MIELYLTDLYVKWNLSQSRQNYVFIDTSLSAVKEVWCWKPIIFKLNVRQIMITTFFRVKRYRETDREEQERKNKHE